MRKALLIALAVIVLALGTFAVVIAMQPGKMHIERSAAIAAPPAEVFAVVNNFRNWEEWSPWAKLDPNVKNTYEGPAEGEGAIFKWNGNDQVGEGKMTLTESKPNEHIKMKLDFIRPMADTADVAFDFKPDGDQTVIVWSMDSEQNFMEKAFCLFVDLDDMIGADFNKGLASLKSIVESKKDAPGDAPSQEAPGSTEEPARTDEPAEAPPAN